MALTIPASRYGTWPIAPSELPPCADISVAGNRSRLTDANRKAILAAVYCTAPAATADEIEPGVSND